MDSILLPVAATAAEIHTASGAGDLTRVTALVDSAAALAALPDDRQCFPVHFAAGGGHVAVMELLHARGADLSVLEHVEGDYEFVDSGGKRRASSRRLVPYVTLLEGREQGAVTG